jgi:broad specificity polyphosphatase/5'/3'-nucleotidase SurE
VIITTEEESHNIDFSRDRMIIADGRPQACVDRAYSLLYAEEFDEIIIGIDPGKYPGIAVLGNGKTISVHHVSAGEVCPLIKNILREFDGKNVLVRIGHGARLVRSRLVNDMLDLGLHIESDIIAAINIARIKGKKVGKQFIEPSQGEVRVIQEHSREHSNGRSTIPRLLARAVAKGEMTLEEAVEQHNGF